MFCFAALMSWLIPVKAVIGQQYFLKILFYFKGIYVKTSICFEKAKSGMKFVLNEGES